MEKFVVTGGRPLEGEVNINGAKNSVVAIIPAAILVDGPCTIENIPNINDVKTLISILKDLGAEIKFESKDTLSINSQNIKSYTATYDMVKCLRASYYLMGALLGRFKKAEVSLPGGCDFGFRPIDQHIKGFEALGAKVKIDHGVVKLEAEKLVGAQIYMDVVSVGATINIMLAAVKAEGTTIIENASKEPHVVDVANFLNAMGANIKGAGTDVIKIKGVPGLPGGTSHSIIPDMIEAGTFMIAAATTKGDVTVKNIIPKHVESLSAKLVEMNVKVQEGGDYVRVIGTDKIERANIKTLPYPGFPTDLHPPTSVLLCLADGTSTVTEGIWDSRFQYVDELKRMGAKIKVEGRIAIIEGVGKLSGAPVKATDLRAGAALVIAGLVAEGVTEVYNIRYIDRGYENIEGKLSKLGAQIVRK
ncbi:UDP-N-acetylglucosamine 1-carboxyvinyltransferase [Acetivibrio thermocellus AD2]|uniref:UDP-N-acetylglucosamine 1-carboxyvinyltransferase n=1 Tax=Acetivibrio thermocellus AD2 TaxID=1138384 RepID=A0AB36TL91_ACETH|nr:UDP-N-acetylglucosamine 1-carboxyvinyltransferase [Acetivibrio thermocellus]ADU75967.1 UDP-N-acetylglucosamine 1-carboxyvinyltransferase [Acetivibrio thermocellus DSM 1313]ALX10002.1 UDP-N-acetylglucosamine 1-carboxyvinyltransferase [Acetivibrio thermocellus AD2]ANV77776.1 UDP-N-acetylglucosamine 1-carboxyvinyltransferase [Acetivibrio thermocellus DSM 2360]EIC03801.1 UDP-N-acetylglucosamine 1-carboxyvinyltransferase [Acetivibrio thermocellus YS]PFH04286.1 UDP-N-acetylglucosamine 1-carboxyvi